MKIIEVYTILFHSTSFNIKQTDNFDLYLVNVFDKFLIEAKTVFSLYI